MILMHKDIPAADIALLGTRILSVDVLDRAHMPPGTVGRNGMLTAAKLQRWLETRAIPRERQGRGQIEKALGCSACEAMLRSPGISLTDCYWFKHEGQECQSSITPLDP